jgi:hypothetical protein
MSNIDIVDDSFDKNITTSYFLSIQVSLNGLSFSVLDPVRNTYILFKHFGYEKKDNNYVKTQEHLITDPVLNYDYKRVFFLFNTMNASLVPGALFNNDKAELLLSFSSRIKDPHKTENHKIKLADVWNVYAIPDYLYYLVKSQFRDVVFFQQYIPMIEVSLMSGVVDDYPVMYINLQDDIFDVIVLKRYEVMFCNSFRYKNSAEFTYFTLNALKQLELDQKKLKVFVSGEGLNDGECISLLRRYVRNVRFVTSPRQFEFSPKFRSVKTEKYYNLLSLPLCV